MWPNAPLPPHKIELEKHTGDICDRSLVSEVIRPKEAGQQVVVFHLASIMSAQGEKHFDKCLRVNVDGTRSLMDACRDLVTKDKAVESPVRFIFPSSIAAFGPQPEVDDNSRLLPTSTYGTTKAIVELMVNDYTRKGGLVDAWGMQLDQARGHEVKDVLGCSRV